MLPGAPRADWRQEKTLAWVTFLTQNFPMKKLRVFPAPSHTFRVPWELIHGS